MDGHPTGNYYVYTSRLPEVTECTVSQLLIYDLLLVLCNNHVTSLYRFQATVSCIIE